MPQFSTPFLRAGLCLAAFAALTACGDKAADSPSAAEPSAPAASAPAAPAVIGPDTSPSEPSAESPLAAGGPLTNLRPELGRYPHEGGVYLRQGPLAERLRALLGQERYEVLLQNLQVSGPLSEEGDVWFITGNRQHQGGVEQAAVAFAPDLGVMRVWLLHDGKAQEFTDPPGAQLTWPTDVQTTLKNAAGG